MVSQVSSINTAGISTQIHPQQLQSGSIKIFTLKNVATVAGGILLFAGVSAGAGTLLTMGGTRLLSSSPALHTAGRASIVAGEKLFLVGKGAFLSVAVPVYTVTWVVPKWICNVAIPKSLNFAHEYVAVPFGKYVVVPVSKGIVKAYTVLREPLLKAAQKTYKLVLEPLKNAVLTAGKWSWKTIVVPSADALGKILSTIFDRALLPALKWSWNNVIDPGLNALFRVIFNLFDKIVIPLGKLTAHTATKVWNTAVLPVLSPLGKATAGAMNLIWNTAALPAAKATARAIDAVREATSWMTRSFVTP